MRKSIRAFANIVSSTLPLTGPIYEFGSFQIPEQLGFADLRPIFKDHEYVGCDMRPGPGVDLVLNLHEIDLPSRSVGTVLCLDTLEHVEHPRKALQEIYRILRPDGIVIISSVMNFPIHDYPHDYWRFTPEAFRSILNPFAHSFVGFQGNKNFPHTVVGIGFKAQMTPTAEFNEKFILWQQRDKWTLRQLTVNLTPPICLPMVAWLYRTVVGLTSSRSL